MRTESAAYQIKLSSVHSNWKRSVEWRVEKQFSSELLSLSRQLSKCHLGFLIELICSICGRSRKVAQLPVFRFGRWSRGRNRSDILIKNSGIACKLRLDFNEVFYDLKLT